MKNACGSQPRFDEYSYKRMVNKSPSPADYTINRDLVKKDEFRHKTVYLMFIICFRKLLVQMKGSIKITNTSQNFLEKSMSCHPLRNTI